MESRLMSRFLAWPWRALIRANEPHSRTALKNVRVTCASRCFHLILERIFRLAIFLSCTIARRICSAPFCFMIRISSENCCAHKAGREKNGNTNDQLMIIKSSDNERTTSLSLKIQIWSFGQSHRLVWEWEQIMKTSRGQLLSPYEFSADLSYSHIDKCGSGNKWWSCGSLKDHFILSIWSWCNWKPGNSLKWRNRFAYGNSNYSHI